MTTIDTTSNYVTEDLNPARIGAIADSIKYNSAEDYEVLVEQIDRLDRWIEEVAGPAVDGLIEVHRATGIDLKHWEPVLRLVQSVRPNFSIVGEREW